MNPIAYLVFGIALTMIVSAQLYADLNLNLNQIDVLPFSNAIIQFASATHINGEPHISQASILDGAQNAHVDLGNFTNKRFADTKVLEQTVTNNNDGTQTVTVTQAFGLPTRLADKFGNFDTPIFIKEDSSIIQLESGQGSIVWDKSQCALSFYNNTHITPNHKEIFKSDSYVVKHFNGTHVLDIPSINTATCNTTLVQNGNDVQIHGSKSSSEGTFVVKIIKNEDDKYKPQLEFTPSSFGSSQFVITESLHIPNAMIYNNDEYKAQGANIVIKKQGGGQPEITNTKIIDIGETTEFTFPAHPNVVYDISSGLQSLNKTMVIMSPPDTPKLVLDFVSPTISDGQTFVLDPFYSTNNPTVDGDMADTNNNDVCDATLPSESKDTSGTTLDVGTRGTSQTTDCFRSFVEFDIVVIPDNADVTDSHLKSDVESLLGTPDDCDYVSIATRPSTSTGIHIWGNATSGTVMVDNDALCNTTGNNKDIDLTSVGDSEIESRLAGNWFAIVIKGDNEVLGAGDKVSQIASEEGSATPKPTLEVTYSYKTPPKVQNMVYESVFDVAKKQDQLNFTLNQNGEASDNVIGYLLERNEIGQPVFSPRTVTVGITQEPIAHIRFDDTLATTGTTVKNYGSGAKNTTTTGTLEYRPSPLAHGALFDGTSDFVGVGKETDYDFERTDTFSTSFWYKSGQSSYHSLIAKITGSNGWAVGGQSGKILLTLRNTPTTNELDVRTTPATFNDNKWHHLVVVYDGTSTPTGVKFYDNGGLVSSASTVNTLSASILNNNGLAVGANNEAGGGLYNGQIDDVRVYKYNMSSTEVSDLYNYQYETFYTYPSEANLAGTANLLANWRFDNSLHDWSRKGNEGVMHTTSKSELYVDGKLGRSHHFDGESNTKGHQINVTNSATENNFDFEENQAWSVTGWLKLRTPSIDTTANTVISKRIGLTSSDSWGIFFITSSNALQLRYANTVPTDTLITTPNNAIKRNTWHYFALVANGANSGNPANDIDLYVDGVDTGATCTGACGTLSGTYSNANDVTIGAGSSAINRPFEGDIDDIRVYNKALSLTELWAIGNMTSYRDYHYPSETNLAGTANLVAQWDMDGIAYDNIRQYGASENGAIDYVDSNIGKAVNLDGNENLIDQGLESNFDFERTSPFSISGWIKTSDSSACCHYIVEKRLDSSPFDGYVWYIDSTGEQVLLIQNTVGAIQQGSGVTTGKLNDNKWHNVVWTYDGTSIASGVLLYIDGKSHAKDNELNTLSSGSILNNEPLSIGGNDDSTNFFNGQLDEIRVYNDVLTATEVSNLYKMFAHRYVNFEDLNQQPPYYYNYTAFSVNPVGLSLVGNSELSTVAPDSVFDENIYTTSNQEGIEVIVSPDLYELESNLAGTANLVSNWKFDTTLQDYTANRNHLTMGNGIETYTVGKLKQAIEFDGSTNYVQDVDEDDYDFERTDDFSISVWTKKNNIGIAKGIVAKDSAPTTTGYNLRWQTGDTIRFQLTNTILTNEIRVTTVNKFPDLDWHHVVTTYDGSSSGSGVKIYVDGVNQAVTIEQNSLSASILNNNVLRVGAFGDGSLIHHGSIDDVRIYNDVLTSTEVTNLYEEGFKTYTEHNSYYLGRLNSTENYYREEPFGIPPPIAHWKFDGEETGTLNYGTANLDPLLLVAGTEKYTTGNITSSLNLDGNTYFVTSEPDKYKFDFEKTDPFSIAFWINGKESGTKQQILGKNTNIHNVGGFYIWDWEGASDGKLEFDLADQATTSYAIGTVSSVLDNKWHHVVFTFNGNSNRNGLKAYVDGSQTSTGGALAIASSIISTDKLAIGSTTDGEFNSKFKLDDIRIYNYELSSTRVSKLYDWGIDFKLNNTRQQYTPESKLAGTTNLVANWKFDNSLFDSKNYTNDGFLSKPWDSTPLVNPEKQKEKYADGVFGQALLMDSFTNNVMAINVTETNFDFERTNTFSSCAWGKTDKGTLGMILAKNNITPNTRGYYMWLDNQGNFVTTLRSVTTTNELEEESTTTVTNDGKWHHYCFTYDGTSSPNGLDLYVDGTNRTTTIIDNTLTGTILNDQNLLIGYDSFGADAWNGALDDIRIYNKELTKGEVLAIMNQGNYTEYKYPEESELAGTANLLLNMHLDGNRAETTNPRFNSTITGKNFYEDGKFGEAYSFNSADWITINNETRFDFERTQPFSISLWAKPDSTIANQDVIIAKTNDAGSTGSIGYAIIYRTINSSIQFRIIDSLGNIFSPANSGTDTVPLNVWTNIVVTFSGNSDNSGINIYTNGTLKQTGTSSPISNTILNNLLLTIGAESDGGAPFNGLIDEIKIYNDVLQPFEVKRLYDMTDFRNGTRLLDTDVSIGQAKTYKSYIASNNAGQSGGVITSGVQVGSSTSGEIQGVGEDGTSEPPQTSGSYNPMVGDIDDTSCSFLTGPFRIVCTWSKPPPEEVVTGYNIQRKPNASCNNSLWGVIVNNTATPNTLSYTNNLPLCVQSVYQYNVTAWGKVQGDQGTGNIATVTAVANWPPSITVSFPDNKRHVVGDVVEGNVTVTQSADTFPNFTVNWIAIKGVSQDANKTINLVNDSHGTVTHRLWGEFDGTKTVNATLKITNQTGSSVTFTSTPNLSITQEYTPAYFPSEEPIGTPIQVNFTHKRINNGAIVDLKVNRQIITPTWELECNFKQTIFGVGPWQNKSGVGNYEVNQTVPQTRNVYITCYNDDLLFTTVSYGQTNATQSLSDLTSSLGSFFGVPIPFLFIIFLAAIFTGRSAPTGIIFLAASIGLMGIMGYFPTADDDPTNLLTVAFWGMIVLLTALGVFMGKRFH